MYRIFLLNKILILFFPFLLWGFENLYSLNEDDFEISKSKNEYRLTIKKQQFIDYSKLDGFKFFIPKFTKEFSIKVLRYNSIGYINGILSMDNTFSKVLQTISKSDLKYYLTDYSTTNQKELDYLLKGYSIPYTKVTSLSIEAYNIPKKVSINLNKNIFFKIIHIKDNKLKYILYSAYIVLDRKMVDKYTKKAFPKSKNLIITFLNNINSIKINLSFKKKKSKKIIKKVSLPKYRLNLHRFLFMKEYGYLYENKETKIDITKLSQSKDEVLTKLDKLNNQLYKKLNKRFILNGKDIYKWYNNNTDIIIDKIDELPLLIEKKENKCMFNPNNINKECFKNPTYFHNYIYYQIKRNSILDDDEILVHAGYKTFNDVGKYYFEIGNFQKAEIYLQRAYVLANDKLLPMHNLAVLYATYSDLYDIKKAVKYLKESTMQIDYYNLGVMYYLGKGVKESDKKAREYFSKALDIPYAKENFEIMKKYKIGIK